MKNSLGKNNATKMTLHIVSMFVFVLALTSGMAYAESTDEITFLSGTTITAGSTTSTLVPLDLDNVSTSKGGTVKIYPQSGVNSLTVAMNGTTCQTANVGSITPVPYNCNSTVFTTGILQGTANISITNNGATSHILSATVSARYTETAPAFNTSGLATSAEVQSVNNTLLSVNTSINANIDDFEATELSHFTTVNATANATYNVANQINTTINSDTWKDSLAERIRLALDGILHVLVRQSQILFE